MSLPASVVALRHRNFRLLWIGLLLSFTGSMMQNAGLLWHVSLLVPGNKGLALGMVGLVKVVPIVVFSMISGVLADAWDRRKLMLLTQIAPVGVALTLAVLTLRGVTWCGRSTCWPRWAPRSARSTCRPATRSCRSLVPREHLPNAISLNTIMFQIASVAGPSIGGMLIAIGGVAWVYVANAVSFGCDRGAADDARPAEARAD